MLSWPGWQSTLKSIFSKAFCNSVPFKNAWGLGQWKESRHRQFGISVCRSHPSPNSRRPFRTPSASSTSTQDDEAGKRRLEILSRYTGQVWIEESCIETSPVKFDRSDLCSNVKRPRHIFVVTSTSILYPSTVSR